MCSQDNIQETKQEKCVESMVQSVLDGRKSIEELQADIEGCEDLTMSPEELTKLIKDCLKNRMERKCCPDKIVNELRTKIGISGIAALIPMFSFTQLFF